MRIRTAVLAILICNTFPAALVHAVVAPPEPEYENSLTITTYYPSPRAVYNTMRFSPNDSFTPDDDCPREGEISFHSTMHDLYICQGTPPKWKKTTGVEQRAAGGLGVKNNGDDLLSPGVCDGMSGLTDTGDIMCSKPFYQDITFLTPFNNIPEVIVAAQRVSSWSNDCAGRANDKASAYVEEGSITKTGFRLRAGGSPMDGECVNTTTGIDYWNYSSRATASWVAIGE